MLKRSLRAQKVDACPDSPFFLAGTDQSSIRVAAGGVVPDAKFNFFWRPHVSERAPL